MGLKNEDYAFAVGKVRVLETRLIKKESFEEMTERGSATEALRLLSEVGDYDEEFVHIRDSSILESSLKKVAEENTGLTKKLLLEERLFEALLCLDEPVKCLALTLRCKNRFLLEFLQSVIDLANIKFFLRLVNLQRPRDDLARLLLSNGRITQDNFLRLYHQPLHIVISNFRYTPYAEVVREGIQYYQQNNSFLYLERKIDDYLIGFLKRAKYISLGPEPILAYYLAKENELKLIRWVIVGRLNDLPKEDILVRLNDTYA